MNFISGWFAKEGEQDLRDQVENRTVSSVVSRHAFGGAPPLTVGVALPTERLLV